MRKYRLPFLITAVHSGSYQSVKPLEKEFGSDKTGFLLDGAALKERDDNTLSCLSVTSILRDWRTGYCELDEDSVKALVIGTSELPKESNVEMLMSELANKEGIPVFVIEDYPGNYWPIRDLNCTSIFVESVFAANLQVGRGEARKKIFVTGNPRYDRFASINKEKERISGRAILDLGVSKVVLWAGQPDFKDSFLTFDRLTKFLATQNIVILFRAHPRDEGYRAGEYRAFFEDNRINIIDVSEFDNTIQLCCMSDLVVTQYSSLAVEASYLGIPAVFVLFEDLAGYKFKISKGYDKPVWSEEGCGFLIRTEGDIKDVLIRSLFDRDERFWACKNFAHHFRTSGDSARTIADQIKKSISYGSADGLAG